MYGHLLRRMIVGETKANVSGSTIKHVTCERCGEAYVYVLSRSGAAWGRSWLRLDMDAASQRAATKARSSLDHQLSNGCDRVACPDCGWYQRNMVRKTRIIRLAWVLGGIIVLWVAAQFACTLSNDFRRSWEINEGSIYGIGLLLATAASIVTLRSQVNRSGDVRACPTSGQIGERLKARHGKSPRWQHRPELLPPRRSRYSVGRGFSAKAGHGQQRRHLQ